MGKMKLSDVLVIGKNGTLCLNAKAKIVLKNKKGKPYKGSAKPSDPPAEFDFKFDAEGGEKGGGIYGAGTAFLQGGDE